MNIPLKKKILFTIIIILIFQILFIAAIEIFGRLYIHMRYGVPGKSYGIYMGDKELGASHRPNSYNINTVINNWGFRNVEDISEQKSQGVMRIYCSGGSTVFCYNLPTEESWPSILKQKLRRIPGHEDDEVLNAGQICFAVSHEFALAKRHIPRLKPDVVILYGTGTNEDLASAELRDKEGRDLGQLLKNKEWGVFPRSLDQAQFLKRHSILVKLYDYKMRQWFEEKLAEGFRKKYIFSEHSHPHQWAIENFDNTLRAYIDFLHENGCKVIMVRYGDNGMEDPYLINYIRMFRDRAVRIGKEKGAIICDVASFVEKHTHRKDLYIGSGVHVTHKGAELVSDALLPILLKIDKK